MLSTGRRHGLLTLAPSAAAVKRAVYLDFPKADTRGRRLGVDERRARPDPLELGTRSPRPPFRSRRTNFFVRLPSLNNLFVSDRSPAAR